jgi:nucleoside-triphosphatase
MANILITGYPGAGKTTLIRELVSELRAGNPQGFYTQEIRTAGVRKGFEWVDLRGGRGVLAHDGLAGPHRVGKYGVDLGGFEAYLASLDLAAIGTGVVVIDEIGKMECLSARFRSLVLEALGSDRLLVVATIALKGTDFIETIKRRGDVELFHLQTGNRDTLKQIILHRLGDELKG